MKESLFEKVYRWRYYDLNKALGDIYETKALTCDEFNNWQEERKWEIVKHHYANNTFYKDKAGDALPQHWEELPVISKTDLQTDFDRLISKPYNIKELYINNTSGSSGHPLRFAKDYYTQARVWAYKKLFSNMYGIDYFTSKEAKFYGMPKSFRASLVQNLKDWILNRDRFVVFDLSEVVFDSWVEKFRSKRYDYIYGYTSSIVLFCRYLIKHNIVLKEICPTLKIVIVTSETCSVEDKVIIKLACGVEARNEYGTAEAGLIGYECVKGNIHIAEENIFVEANEQNELLITDLFNRAFPLIRYRIGDIAELSTEFCACGSHNRFITKLQGRTNDVARLKNGKIIPGLTFYYISRALLEASGVLKEFIIRQTALDTFEFDVVSDFPLQTTDITGLKKTAEEYLEPGLHIIVNQVTQIQRPSSGKLKHFYSELDNQ